MKGTMLIYTFSPFVRHLFDALLSMQLLAKLKVLLLLSKHLCAYSVVDCAINPPQFQII